MRERCKSGGAVGHLRPFRGKTVARKAKAAMWRPRSPTRRRERPGAVSRPRGVPYVCGQDGRRGIQREAHGPPARAVRQAGCPMNGSNQAGSWQGVAGRPRVSRALMRAPSSARDVWMNMDCAYFSFRSGSSSPFSIPADSPMRPHRWICVWNVPVRPPT